MLALLAAALLVQDPPPEPPTPPEPPAVADLQATLDRLRTTLGDDNAISNGDRIVLWQTPPSPDGELPNVVELKGVAQDVINRFEFGAPPARPAVPAIGTLKLTAPDGTVTEYRAEFTPDPPAPPEPPARGLIGVHILNRNVDGDPPGLTVEKVVEGSAAAEAGLKDGDRLISVGDEPLESFRVLRLKVDAAAEKDEPLAVKVVRKEGADEEGTDGDAEPKTAKILRFELVPKRQFDGTDGSEPSIAVLRGDGGRYRAILSPKFSFGPATIRPADAAAVEARVRAAETVLRQAEKDLRRKQALLSDGFASEAAFDKAVATLANAEAELAAAKAKTGRGSLDELREQLAALRAELEAMKADRE